MTHINLTKNRILINGKQLAKRVNAMSNEQRSNFFNNLENELLQTDKDLQNLLMQLNESERVQHAYVPEKYKSKIVILTALLSGLAGGLFGYATKQEIFAMFTNAAMFSLIGVLIGEITCKIIENKYMKKLINKIKKSNLESEVLKKYKQKLLLTTKLKELQDITDYLPTKEVKLVMKEQSPQKTVELENTTQVECVK